jgi:CheY-like chemotaxis protein
MVDDEDLLLTMGHTVLSAYGYRVLLANSGQKALEIVEKNDVTIDLVITDLVMPAMSGRELVERIHQLLPETPILCTSGFVRPTGQEHEDVYLQKPFTSQDLLVKVKQALARQGRQEKP